MKRKPLDHVVAAVSAGLQSVPFAGGLGRFLDEYYPGALSRQLDALCQQLSEEAQAINELKCDVDALPALITRILFESLQTNSELKRQAFRRIILNFARGLGAEAPRVETFVSILARLSELQIRMLALGRRLPSEPNDFKGTEYDGKHVADYFPDFPIGLLVAEYTGLAQACLVQLTPIAPFPFHDTNLLITRLMLTPLGREFLGWIEE